EPIAYPSSLIVPPAQALTRATSQGYAKGGTTPRLVPAAETCRGETRETSPGCPSLPSQLAHRRHAHGALFRRAGHDFPPDLERCPFPVSRFVSVSPGVAGVGSGVGRVPGRNHPQRPDGHPYGRDRLGVGGTHGRICPHADARPGTP